MAGEVLRDLPTAPGTVLAPGEYILQYSAPDWFLRAYQAAPDWAQRLERQLIARGANVRVLGGGVAALSGSERAFQVRVRVLSQPAASVTAQGVGLVPAAVGVAGLVTIAIVSAALGVVLGLAVQLVRVAQIVVPDAPTAHRYSWAVVLGAGGLALWALSRVVREARP